MNKLKLFILICCFLANSPSYGSDPQSIVLQDIVTDLMDQNIIRFGQFTLKNGSSSPIYIDLRSVISYPTSLEAIVEQYIQLIHENNITFDRIAGISYGALGIAFQVATRLKKPIVLVKKEDEKKYGVGDTGLIGYYNT